MTSMPVVRFLSCILVALAAEAASAQSGRTPRSDPDDVFRRLDGDGDGRLSATELRAFPGARRVPDLLQRLDRDGDGSLVPAEFRAITSMAGKATTPDAPAPTPELSPPVVAAGTAEEVDRFLAASAYSAQHAGLCLLVMKDGEVVFEQHVAGSGPTTAYQIASGTKSFWGPAAIAAIAEGLFTLDEAVAETIPEWRDDPRKSRITVRDLLSFASGLEAPRRLWAEKDKDLYPLVLALPAVSEPGTKFAYSEVHLYAFGEFFRRKLAARAKESGGKVETPWLYLDRKILTPIGLTDIRWVRDGSGQRAMGDGAVLTARQWAQYGEFLRLGGAWQGEQLLPAERLADCFVSSQANPAYGLTFWLNKASAAGAAEQADVAGAGRRRQSDAVSAEGIVPGCLPRLVMAAGAGQQRLFVEPENKLVIVRFANADMPRLVMAGDYGKLQLGFEDAVFFAKLLGLTSK